MVKVIVILLIALVFEAVGVVLLSAGLKELGEMPKMTFQALGAMLRQGITQPKILLGIFCELIFFGFLIVLLKRNDVSLIWPLTSLGFVLTALSARFILHEHVSTSRWIGVLLIMAGAAMVSWSERAKQPASEEGAATPIHASTTQTHTE
jgi:drug/metabolite transporter (DMT)-like permease